mmetsp:Transcript_127382/g.179786  ORF Transcript_127382/g.179786 Transcript_127382/m.179786 type:complete len:192 (+) Transcript_127382:45-620(+)
MGVLAKVAVMMTCAIVNTGCLGASVTSDIPAGCTFTVHDPGFDNSGVTYTFNLAAIAPEAGKGYNVSVPDARFPWVDVNLCNGARCPCLSQPSAICQCENRGAQDHATLTTRTASAVPGSFGSMLKLNFNVNEAGAIHKTNVFLVCDPQEYGLRVLDADLTGDGHGGVAYTFASKAGCGSRAAPPPPPHDN